MSSDSLTPVTITSATNKGGFSFEMQFGAQSANTSFLSAANSLQPFGNSSFVDASLIKLPQTTITTSINAGINVSSMSSNKTTSVTSVIPQANVTTVAPSFNISGATTVLTTSSLHTLPKMTTASLNPTVSKTNTTPAFVNLTTATKTTDSSAVTNITQMSYNQLEEHINKWTLELEEHEKVFIDQATQINAWDKILICNNDKILELNDAVQKVKAEQNTLEQELEFITTQHKELQETIQPLEKELTQIPQIDLERSQTYLLVEHLDAQLKQMSEDLKEIIDSLNESNKSQEDDDPIIKIGKILSAHMSSLHWIESASANISGKLEKIVEMEENYKRDSEQSFRSSHYN